MARDYAVLIPTKGRAAALTKLFTMCPSLNTPATFVGLDWGEKGAFNQNTNEYGTYSHLFRRKTGPAGHVNVLPVINAGGYTSVAREVLRKAATAHNYKRYVLADDNCQFTDESLGALLHAQAAWPGSVMAGGHPTAKHFHADAIYETGEKRGDASSYQQVGMIFWCVPHKLYKDYQYPPDCYFDDVHFILWCLSRGFTDFRSTLDAPFNKHLHEAGGTGTVAQRIRKRGQGFIRLAEDFPQWMTTSILQTRVPYKQIMRAVHEGRKGFD